LKLYPPSFTAMRTRIAILFFLLLPGLAAHPGKVAVEPAGKAAINFYSAHYSAFNPGFKGNSTIDETLVIEREGQVLYYMFNMLPCGWIAVSADEAAWPVLAYSFEGRFTGENLPPQYVAWMKQYEDALYHLATHPTDALPATSSAWKEILDDSYGRLYGSKAVSQVKPLLYSTWDQGLYYNGQCPPDNRGPGGHTLVGCVPIAMGQIMNYYRWPNTGKGSYSYTDPVYGTLSANFGNTTYNWDNMTNGLVRPNDGVAQLLYHLGISCDLVYGPTGSGMYNHKSAYALRTFFKYSPQTQYLFRDSTTLRWDSIIVAHLNRSMPLYYAGWSVPNINGHAFVCDGYQDTTYFHFNWGWNGSSNGYFYTSNPNPPGYNFKLAQELIINIFPDTVNYTYPPFCQGAKALQMFDGSITDGSGPVKPYSGTADCSWLITPQTAQDSVSTVSVAFNYIKTNPADLVNIYDGETTAAPLLASFSGDTVPAQKTSTGNKMLVTFKANGGTPGKGISLTFSSKFPVWCSGTQVIQGDTGVVTNGSNGFDYSNNSSCRWRLMRNDTLPLTIYFSRFDTEPVYDNLTIYDLGSGKALDTISGRYDGTNLPDSVTAPSGKMFLIFSTNASVTGKGWEIYYPRRGVGIKEKTAGKQLVIYPNPASGRFSVKFNSSQACSAELLISAPDGRPVLNRKISMTAGENTIVQQVTGISPGMYIVTLKSTDAVETGKVIIDGD